MSEHTVTHDPDWQVVDAENGGALTEASFDLDGANDATPPGYTVYRCVYCNLTFVSEDNQYADDPEWCPRGCEHDDANERGLHEVDDA